MLLLDPLDELDVLVLDPFDELDVLDEEETPLEVLDEVEEDTPLDVLEETPLEVLVSNRRCSCSKTSLRSTMCSKRCRSRSRSLDRRRGGRVPRSRSIRRLSWSSRRSRSRK